MYNKEVANEIMEKVDKYPRFPLAALPTPIHPLNKLSSS